MRRQAVLVVGFEDAHTQIARHGTNQESQEKAWDTCVAKGRYSKEIPTLSGQFVNETTLGEADFAARVQAAVDNAEAVWAAYSQATEALTPPPFGWEGMLASHDGDAEAARVEFNNNDWIAEARKFTPLFRDPWAEFKVDAQDPREEYLKPARKAGKFPFFNLVIDGEWHCMSEAEWLSVGDGSLANVLWCERVEALLAAVPADTPIVLMDCLFK